LIQINYTDVGVMRLRGLEVSTFIGDQRASPPIFAVAAFAASAAGVLPGATITLT